MDSARLRWTEVLTLAETDVPPPAEGEVTIDVGAAGVNPADYEHLSPRAAPTARWRCPSTTRSLA